MLENIKNLLFFCLKVLDGETWYTELIKVDGLGLDVKLWCYWLDDHTDSKHMAHYLNKMFLTEGFLEHNSPFSNNLCGSKKL